MTSRFFRLPRIAFAATLAGLLVSGCGGNSGDRVKSASAPPPSAGGSWAGRNSVSEAIQLLNDGEAVRARKLLANVLKKEPGDSVARQLIGQIDGDPKAMLGSQKYRYTLKEGESLSLLAHRHLGSPIMFYALARYNDIAVPTSIRPGQTILIPGRAPPPPVIAKPAPKPTPATPKQPAPTASKPAPSTAKPVRRSANAAQASRLRGQGLAAMNAGAINRAVALLRQALSLDPASALIKNDLGRALRIQGTVRSRP